MALEYDADKGVLSPATPARTTLTIPSDWNGISFVAEVQVHPNGRHIYVSNRGHDSIAVISFDPESGASRAVAWHQKLVSFPRGLTMSPEGDVLIVANQKGDHMGVVALAVSPNGASLDVAGRLVTVQNASDAIFV
jgi:6-phosphogluconolactonase